MGQKDTMLIILSLFMVMSSHIVFSQGTGNDEDVTAVYAANGTDVVPSMSATATMSTVSTSTISITPTSTATSSPTSTATASSTATKTSSSMSPEPTSTPTTPSTSTPPTTVTASVTATTGTTPKPTPTKGGGGGQHFDAASFIGGIVLTTGLFVLGFFGCKFYKSRVERNYHTL
ncbi:sialomucin core protein 24 [Lingula anatina]|uniref:Sialomucin core protein 24 n=1 Tax=Lingula anatina TaxID=7574 RepID=A0A1S3KGY7_LINAN|nr:sialomucin core protein 24 [Lingula anatina]|eukprot:XP_013421903.1 sialomucin core protein 24 [Lingula anatina]